MNGNPTTESPQQPTLGNDPFFVVPEAAKTYEIVAVPDDVYNGKIAEVKPWAGPNGSRYIFEVEIASGAFAGKRLAYFTPTFIREHTKLGELAAVCGLEIKTGVPLDVRQFIGRELRILTMTLPYKNSSGIVQGSKSYIKTILPSSGASPRVIVSETNGGER